MKDNKTRLKYHQISVKNSRNFHEKKIWFFKVVFYFSSVKKSFDGQFKNGKKSFFTLLNDNKTDLFVYGGIIER